MKEELLKLAARVEKLSGPDREVDAEVAMSTGRFFLAEPRYEGAVRMYGYIDPDGCRVEPGNGSQHSLIPAYTASLDAAMTLVPAKDRWPQIEYIGPNPNNPKQGHRATLWPKNGQMARGHSLVSFPLALTAAALRALAKEK